MHEFIVGPLPFGRDTDRSAPTTQGDHGGWKSAGMVCQNL